MQIAIITGSTRDGRLTPKLASWVEANARKYEYDAKFKMLDLKKYDIPLLKEAPWQENRTLNEGTREWLSELAAADGYIIVTPEYNHSVPAALKNAIDHTNGQMNRKPVAIVSHGSNNGVRANEHLRQILNSNIGAFTISATVNFIGNISEAFGEGNTLKDGFEINDSKLDKMLRDSIWYTRALKNARETEA